MSSNHASSDTEGNNNLHIQVAPLESQTYIMFKECSSEQSMREYEGYKWFGYETEIIPGGVVIPEFFGTGFPQYNGLTGNEEWIIKLIEFYKQRWSKGRFCIHGDLALCNVIFGKETVHIVDWEHFHYADKRFYGVDIVNMLFIHLQYEYRWRSYWGLNWIPFIKTKHRLFISECMKLVGTDGLMKLPFSNTNVYIKKYMNPKKFILGKQRPDVLESLDYICQ